MLGWLFLLFFCPVVSPLVCYTGINAEYKAWVNEANRLWNRSNKSVDKEFLEIMNRHMGLSLTMKKEKCSGTDICLMGKNLIMPSRREPAVAYVTRCERRRSCNDFRKILMHNKFIEEVRCCDQELCNLPYPAHIETEQPLSPAEIIKSPKNPKRRPSSNLTLVISFVLPVAVLLLLG